MAFTGNFMATSFKQQLLEGVHDFRLTGGDTFKLALYTNAPRAVIVAVVNDRSAKSVKAVVPDVVGSMRVSVPPPAAYDPELATSLVAVYAVVAAVKLAELVYNASLKVSPPVSRKS